MKNKFLFLLIPLLITACSGQSGSKQSYDNNIYFRIVNYGELMDKDSKSQFENMEYSDKILYKFNYLNVGERYSFDGNKIGGNDVRNFPSVITFKENVLSQYYYDYSSILTKVTSTAYTFESSIVLNNYSILKVGYTTIYSINVNNEMIVIHSGYNGSSGSQTKTVVFCTEAYAKKNSISIFDI